MSYEADEEILQDFLIEAGEILESLSEQLVELENDPDNAELLNAIFRGFHTVKGGAGFLSLTELVDVCHGAENIFDILRNHQRTVTSELMDVILQALDTINDMFALVQAREELTPASPELLAELHRLSVPEGTEAAAPETTPTQAEVSEQKESVPGSDDEMTEDEFERLLDELHGETKPSAPVPSSSTSSNEISDDEFESLLDELHGQGAFSAEMAKASKAETVPNDQIDDDEFENLLDELHGKGKGPQTVSQATTAVTPAPVQPAAKPAEAVKPAASAPVKPAAKKAAADKKAAPTTASQGETTVRVDTQRLDQIMNMVGELVLVRNRLTSLGMTKEDEELTKAVSNLDAVTTDLQGAVMKTRMQPIKKVFGRFPRVVRDLARSLNKEIKLILEGEETDLDKNLVEALADPLVHLVRNSVDHGIEEPDVRQANGKEREGTVILSASQEGDHILLTIRDDGAGMNAEKLKEIAIERGVLDIDAANRLSEQDAFNLIFAPGFSTKTEISEVSGRGVGMDVVKTKITQLNGTVNIDSELGIGTVLEIKVPLTLAILPTLMVIVGEQTFALPLAGVNEIFHLDLTNTNVVDGQLTIIVREKAIPLFYLDQWLVRDYQEKPRDKGHVVIVQLGAQQIGFVVDSLIGQEEVVIKPLDRLLHGTPGMAGATITSDGGIALIIDVPSMLKYYAKKSIVNKKLRS
ncbi:chemotaxis protein CheA [Thalassotalea insulae]|uniref:histidine kinase n=1 Tax=Thalassotalea insulae TaxID=2056778 RepID=A0ABQ6GNN5_9GAMM|nr:chemotaxis protein CheA [Thalassotalea insulae]GLX77603.1 chemotaxis protein CheA [Thalassotalea insulae]